MTLIPGDPLAHRALESLLVAEANVRRRLSLDLEREGLSSTGFFVLVVLATALNDSGVQVTGMMAATLLPVLVFLAMSALVVQRARRIRGLARRPVSGAGKA